jgi:hypothetical protein
VVPEVLQQGRRARRNQRVVIHRHDRAAAAAGLPRHGWLTLNHSHSMVAGGLPETS